MDMYTALVILFIVFAAILMAMVFTGSEGGAIITFTLLGIVAIWIIIMRANGLV